MPDNFQREDAANEVDTLPPELLSLHRRLSDDSADWLHQLPSAEPLAHFASVITQQTSSDPAPGQRSTRMPPATLTMNAPPPTAQVISKPAHVFIPTLVAVVIVALLAAIFVEFHAGMHFSHPGNRTATSTPPPTSTCHYHAAVPSQTHITAIAMTSADDGWAVGGDVIMHYAHCQWQVDGPSYPGLTLTSVAMVSATDGWITGGTDLGTQQLLLHYVAGTWQPVTLPASLAIGGLLANMKMISAAEGWLEITYPKDNQGIARDGMLHYKQGSWTAISAPLGYIADFSSAASDDLWIVGSPQFNDGSTSLAHYRAGEWSQQPGPTRLESAQIALTTASDGVVVFSLYGANNASASKKAVAWRYNGSSWTPLDLGGDRTGQQIYLFSSTQGWAFSKTYPLNPRGDDEFIPISGAAHEVDGVWQSGTWPVTNIYSVVSIAPVSATEYWAIGAAYMPDATGNPGPSVFLHCSNGVWSVIAH